MYLVFPSSPNVKHVHFKIPTEIYAHNELLHMLICGKGLLNNTSTITGQTFEITRNYYKF